MVLPNVHTNGPGPPFRAVTGPFEPWPRITGTPVSSLETERAKITSRAAAGMPAGRIAGETGHDVQVVRRAIGAWAQAEAARALVSQPRKSGRRDRQPKDARERAAAWLKYGGLAVGLLAVISAYVSYEAQFVLVLAAKHQVDVSRVQAIIPDAGAVVFACFGIGLALHGKRAIRCRSLNLVCVGISIAMNALAAAPGWRSTAVWVMAPVIYAVASDTLIGVIRAYAVARQRELNETLADEGITPLGVIGGVLLWLLRLCAAPPSTLSGFRAWVVEECPVAPGKRAAIEPAAQRKAIGPPKRPRSPHGNRADSKTAKFLQLVTEKHGPLNQLDVKRVSPICTELAPQAELDTAAARGALKKAVLKAQENGSAS